jgi:hypothetical protein
MSFTIEERTVRVKKDCKTCEHVEVCKFHSKMNDLCKTNEFYSMTKYLEWNNSLEAFELYASCQFFKLNFKIPENSTLHLDIDSKIISEIVRLEKPEGLSSWTHSVKDNTVTYYFNGSDPMIIKLTELLAKYKFYQSK